MLIGVAVFVAPTVITQLVIMSGAIATAVALCIYHPADMFTTAVYVFHRAGLLVSAVVACTALWKGGLPSEAGRRGIPNCSTVGRSGFLTTEHLVYLGALLAIPLFFLLVSGFAPLTENKRGISLISSEVSRNLEQSSSAALRVAAVVVTEISRPAGLALFASGLLAVTYLIVQTFRLERIPRNRMYVVLILTFFSMLFWSFFEQAGSSLNNFTDRNVDRVFEERELTKADVNTTIRFRVSSPIRRKKQPTCSACPC